MKVIKFHWRLLLFLPLLIACSKEKEQPPKKAVPQVTPQPPKDTLKKIVSDTGLYRSYKLTGAQSLSDLSQKLGPEKMLILLKINRRDLKHLKEGETYAVPNSGDNEITYSPFPTHVSLLDSIHRVLLVSRKVQAFAAYENGKLIKWGPTSTGKKSTPTPEGLYHTNWKSKETHSTVDDAWLLKWYFNLDNLEGISMHEYDLPGYPVSHSCVRLLSEDAEWIYNWAEQWKLSPDGKTVAENGTPVIVFGEYGYGKTPPWKKITADPHASEVQPNDLNSVIQRYLLQKKYCMKTPLTVKITSAMKSEKVLSLIKKYWTVFIYIAATAFTNAFYYADSFKYVDSVERFENGIYYRFLEFSHILWRPFGYLMHQVLKVLPNFFITSDPRQQIVDSFLLMTWFAGFVAIIFLIKILSILKIRQWEIHLTAIFLIFSNAFLNFTQEGSSYVVGFTFVLAGIYFILRHELHDRQILDIVLGAAMLGLAISFWIPYIFSLPAALLIPIICFGFSRKRFRSAAITAAITILSVCIVFFTVLLLLNLEPMQSFKDWVAFSKDAAQQLNGIQRVIFGFPKLFINMGNGGISLKRYLLHDPYNPVSLFNLVILVLWKVILFYGMLFFMILTLWNRRHRRMLFLLLVGTLPMLLFAVKFDGAANERYFPLLAFLIITFAYGIGISTNKKLNLFRSICFGFIASVIIVDTTAMCIENLKNEESTAKEELAQIAPFLASKPQSIILTLTIDKLVTLKYAPGSDSSKSIPPYRPVYLVELNTGRILTWKQALGDSIQYAWNNGGDVWLETHLLDSIPKEETGWVELQDPRVRWKDIREVIRAFNTETPIKNNGESFALLKKTSANSQVVDSLSKLIVFNH